MPPTKDAPPAPASPVPDQLFRARTVLLFGEIDSDLARDVVAQLIALAAASSAPIRLLISSPGGHVESGDAIHDVIRFVGAPVYTIGTGWVASAAALAFVAAARERRVCLPNTRFLLHQPLGGIGGAAAEVEIEARQMLAIRDRVNRILARETGQPVERLEADTRRNFWLTAGEAKEYGLVSRVIERVDDVAGG